MSETPLNHADIIDLIPGYALGGLPDDESRTVAIHLEGCAGCRAELRAYEDLMAGIAAAEIPQVLAPASLQGRVMRQVRGPAPAAAPRRESIWQRFRLPQLSFRMVGALAALALVVIAAAVWLPGAQPSTLHTVHMQGTDHAPGATALFEGDARGTEATLHITGLTPLDPSKQYQLWLIKPDGSRDSGAVFSVEQDGSALVHVTAAQHLDFYKALGVTIEPAGGSPGPTGLKVLGSS